MLRFLIGSDHSGGGFLESGGVNSFSELNRFKDWVAQLLPFAFTDKERIWLQYRCIAVFPLPQDL
ncbi:MAG: hypothetical protein K2N05_11875 [Muribaculaceae bacterium]|nr:hypothetical protein [Muribaculaceae bacterium]